MTEENEEHPAGSEHDATVENVRIIGDEDATEPVLRFGDAEEQLPHWSEPPTGEVPSLFAGNEEELEAWSELPSHPPTWREDRSAFSNVDFDDMGLFAEGSPLSAVAADDTTGPITAPTGENAFLASLSEPEAPRVTSIRTRSNDRAGAGPAKRPEGAGGFTGTRGTAGRDMTTAVVVGVGLGIVLLVLSKAGPAWLAALVAVVLVAGAVELYAALRTVGYRPATLVGIVAVAGLPLATYWHGLATMPIVLALTVATTLCWYLFVDQESRPVPNLAVTLAVVVYVGGLGAFASAMLVLHDGVGILLGTIIVAVAFDIGALFVGSSAGRTQLSPAVSPNKTWEGLIGGGIVAVVVGLLLVELFGGLTPWEKWQHGVQLGLVVAVAASIGDLGESMLKRDLGVKDMGTLLPGHGGILDRIDGFLVAVPAAYLLCLVLRIGVFA